MAKKLLAVDDSAPFDLHHAMALKAIFAKTASPEQAFEAMRWIVEELCRTHKGSYRPDARDHAFMTGRQFPGLQIMRMVRASADTLKQEARKSNG